MATPTLKAVLDQYDTKVSVHKKGYAQEQYRLRQIAQSSIGRKRMRSITSVDVAAYRDARLARVNPKTGIPLSPATVRLEMSLLSNVFDVARVEWGFCDENPVKAVRKPKPPSGRERRLTAREDRRILRYCQGHPNPEFYSIVVIALETAMRQGEILGLHWDSIDLKARVVHLADTKNGSRRDVPLTLTARDALTRLGVKPTGKVFSYTANGLKSTWRVMLTRMGIADLHFHDLRHEAVSRLFELGTLDMMEVAAISGHKSLAMLKRYTHLRAQRLVKKLDGGKSKVRAAVISTLVPYPAVVEGAGENWRVRLLDFEDVRSTSNSREDAIRQAQDALLRRILRAIRENRQLPAPDQYLQPVDLGRIIMVDPLCDAST